MDSRNICTLVIFLVLLVIVTNFIGIFDNKTFIIEEVNKEGYEQTVNAINNGLVSKEIPRKLDNVPTPIMSNNHF